MACHTIELVLLARSLFSVFLCGGGKTKKSEHPDSSLESGVVTNYSLISDPLGDPSDMNVLTLFLLCTETILDSTAIPQSGAFTFLPSKLLRYLLYKAITLKKPAWIQVLVRYWSMETLSFDFDEFIDYSRISDRSESHLRRNYSWFYSHTRPQMKLELWAINSIASGLYLRAYHCHSVDHVCTGTSGSRSEQFIVDLTMMELDDTKSNTASHPLIKLCHGQPLVEVSDGSAKCKLDRTTVTNEKIVVLTNISCRPGHPILSCFGTSPCALQSRNVCLFNDNKALLQALEKFTSLTWQCISTSDSVAKFAELLTSLQEHFSVDLNEVFIYSSGSNDYPNMEVSMPVVACQRIIFSTNYFTRCAYHPHRKLRSLHITAPDVIQSKLEFNSDVSKIIIHNSNSLLDLQMSGVRVEKNNLLLLVETFQKCHTIVVLRIHDANKGSLSSARLYEIFCSLQTLHNLEYLDVSETVNVFAEDLCTLHNLLFQGLPNLKDCCLSFCKLVVFFTLLGDTKFGTIQELLGTLLSGKQPSPHCHTVSFGWKSNKIMLEWLAGLRRNVNFQLLNPSISEL